MELGEAVAGVGGEERFCFCLFGRVGASVGEEDDGFVELVALGEEVVDGAVGGFAGFEEPFEHGEAFEEFGFFVAFFLGEVGGGGLCVGEQGGGEGVEGGGCGGDTGGVQGVEGGDDCFLEEVEGGLGGFFLGLEQFGGEFGFGGVEGGGGEVALGEGEIESLLVEGTLVVLPGLGTLVFGGNGSAVGGAYGVDFGGFVEGADDGADRVEFGVGIIDGRVVARVGWGESY